MRRGSTLLRILAPCLLAAIVAVPTARASGPLWGVPKAPRWSVTPGLSTGVLMAPDVVAGSVSAEVTGAWSLLWLTVGLRSAFHEDAAHLLPFAEVGAYFFANLGIGYSVGLTKALRDGSDHPRVPRHNVHLFVGVPIPLRVFGDPKRKQHRILFLEPYYRPAWGTGGGVTGWSHEVGLLVKFLWGRGQVSISK